MLGRKRKTRKRGKRYKTGKQEDVSFRYRGFELKFSVKRNPPVWCAEINLGLRIRLI